MGYDDFGEYDSFYGESPRKKRVPKLLLGGIVGLFLILAVILLVWRGGHSNDSNDGDGGISQLFTRSTPIPTPLPTIDAHLAAQTLTEATKQWTVRQTIGVDCLLSVCNQRVFLDVTFFHEDLLEAIVLNNFANQSPTEYDLELTSLQQRLQVQGQLPFLLQVKVGGRTGPLRSKMLLGPMEETASLITMRRTSYALADWDDFTLDRPLDLTPQTQHQGYLFFPRFDGTNQPVVDFAGDRSFRIELRVNSELYSDKEVVVWNFPLIDAGDSSDTTTYPEEDIPLEEIVNLVETIIQLAQGQ